LVIVNFHTGCAKKYIMLKLKIRDKQNFYVKRTAHRYIVTSLLLKRLMQPLIETFVQDFKITLFSTKALNILVLFFQTVWIIDFMRPNARQTSAFFFHFLFVLSLYLFFQRSNLPFIRHCSHVPV